MKLSYSNYSTYIKCPRLYYNRVNYVEPPMKESKYFALYGILVEMFFKQYTNVLLKQRVKLSKKKIKEMLWKNWEWILDKNFVEWTDPWVKESSDQIFEQAFQDVLLNIEKFSFWSESQSEVSINVKIKKTDDLFTCRLDFLRRNPEGKIKIIDGKGTKKLDKNVDLEQLYFYALMHLFHFKKLPDRIGFLYYRYQMIKYIDFDEETIENFKKKLLMVKKTIKNDKEFKPKVKLSKQCKWCPYKDTCDAYLDVRSEKNKKKDSIIDVEYNGQVVSF